MAANRILMMIRTDIPAESEAGWNSWYNTRHIPARLDSVPGFLTARRFVTINDSPRYLTLYDLAGAEVLASEPYLQLKKKEAALSAESFEARTPALPNFSLRLFKQIYPENDTYQIPDTEVLFVVAHEVPPDREDAFNAWYDTEHIPAMVDRVPGFVTARRFMAVPPQASPAGAAWTTHPKFLTLYDLENEAVLQSEAFMRETHSPWSAWIRSWYTKKWRFLARSIFQMP